MISSQLPSSKPIVSFDRVRDVLVWKAAHPFARPQSSLFMSRLILASRALRVVFLTFLLIFCGFGQQASAVTPMSAAGQLHTLFLSADGNVWAAGANTYGELGDGTTTQRTNPVFVMSGVTQIAAGESFSLFLKSDGTVWAAGFNTHGELGVGAGVDQHTPVQISGLTGVIAISAGQNHAYFLKGDGSVWVTGMNTSGQLGLGDNTARFSPVQAVASGVVSISAGGAAGLIVKTDGSVWGTGYNLSGQLGLGDTSNRNTFTSILGSGVKSVAVGYRHSLFLMNDGTVKATGLNGNGQLGDGTVTQRNSPVTMTGISGASGVSTANIHSLILKTDGSVWVTGDNAYGQYGDGTTTEVHTAKQIVVGAQAVNAGWCTSHFVRKDGSVWVVGRGGNGQLGSGGTGDISTPRRVAVVSPGATPMVTAGAQNSHVLKADGTVWAIGTNAFGQIGNGTTTAQTSYVTVSGLTDVTAIVNGLHFCLYLKADGTVWASGRNNAGQLGTGDTSNRNVPTQIAGLSGVIAMAAGEAHSLFLKTDGTVWSVGDNAYGQLGDGTNTNRSSPVQVTTLNNVVAIGCGKYHSLFVKADGTAWAVGAAGSGQLGNNGGTDLNVPTLVLGIGNVVGVAGGGGHSLFLKGDGTVWAAGLGTDGQLGDGTFSGKAYVVQAIGLTNMVSVSAGDVSSIFLKSDGTVWGVGANSNGELGDGTTTGRSTPVQMSGVNNVVQARMGSWASHTLLLKSDGSVYGTGLNAYGQLSDGTTTSRSTPVANGLNLQLSPAANMNVARELHTATLLPNGRVLIAGGDAGGAAFASTELYEPQNNTFVTSGSLSVGRQYHTATLLNNGKVLVAGGHLGSPNASTAVCELYDVSTGTWSSTGSLTTARDFHTATLLPNGKVLVAGGENSGGGTAISSAEIYDPNAGTWSSAGNMSSARCAAIGVLLPNGKVLVAGGHDGSSTVLSSAELYDPVANSWSATGAMSSPRQVFAATLLSSGKVLVTTGVNGPVVTAAELYDPSTGTWSAAGSLAQGRYYASMILLPSGKVLAAGGYNAGELNTMEIYDPVSNSWTSGGNMASAHQSFPMVLLPNGQVFIAGGHIPSNYTNICEIYSPYSSFPAGNPVNGASLVDTTLGSFNGGSIFVGGKSTLTNLAGGNLTVTGGQLDVLTATPNGGNLDLKGGNVSLNTGISTASITGNGSVTKNGVGELQLLGTSSYTGGTTVTGGTLTAGGTQAFGTGGLVLSNTAGVSVNLNGFSNSTGALTGGGSLGGNVLLGGGTLTVNTTATPMAVVGNAFSVFLRADGTVLTTGRNNEGQLGNGTTQSTTTPVMPITGVASVAAGTDFVMYLKQDGTVWGGGTGILGDGQGSVIHSVPVQVGTLSGIVAISAGYNHSLFLKQDGTVWGVGYNNYGQLGDGTTTNRLNPVPLASGTLNSITAISAHNGFSLFLKSDGTAWAVGKNDVGQLGDGTIVNKSSPIQVMNNVSAISAGMNQSLFLKNDGTLWSVGSNVYGELLNGGTVASATLTQVQTGVARIFAGYAHSYFIKTDGSVWGAGQSIGSAVTQIGLNNVVSISAGQYNGYHKLFLTAGGGVWASGSGASGQFGGGDDTLGTYSYTNPAFIRNIGYAGIVSGSGGLTVSGSGTQILAGANTYTGVTNIIGGTLLAGGSQAVALSSGVNLANAAGATFALNGISATVNGLSGGGTLGGNVVLDNKAVLTVNNAVSTSFAGGISGIGGLTKSGSGILTLSGASSYTGTTFVSSGSLLLGSTQALSGSSGLSFSATAGALLNLNGFSNTSGALGGGGSSGGGVDLGGGTLTVDTKVTPMAFARSNRIFFLRGDGSVRATGLNDYGQLGDGTTVNKNSPVFIMKGVKSVAMGDYHTVFLKTDGTAWSVGHNVDGELGDGTTVDKTTPIQVMSGVSSIACGYQHTLFVKTDGTVWAAGLNNYGQLGNGGTINSSSPAQVSGLNGVVAASAGSGHSVFLKKDGTVWAVGVNSASQIGDGTTTDRYTPVQVLGVSGVVAMASGSGHNLFVKNDGTAWGTGWNGGGQLGDGSTTNRSNAVQVMTGVSAVGTGHVFSFFVKQDGTVWATGQSSHNQLGNGSAGADILTPVQVSTGVIAASGGDAHSAFVKNDGTVWAAGENTYGQLGDGSTTTRNPAVQVFNLGYAGVISGSGGLVVSGSGTQILAGANTYTGPTTLAGGVLSVNTLTNGGASSQLGASSSAPSNLVFGGGTLQFTGTNATSTDRGFTVNGGKSGTIEVTSPVTVTATGVATGSGVFTKSGMGTLVLAGTNTLSGATSVMGGTLQAGGTQAFGAGGMTLSNTAGAALNLNGFSNTTGALSGGGGNGGNVLLGGGTLSVNTSVSGVGVIQISAGVAGNTGNGQHRTTYVKSDGTVWATGWNVFGALGDGTTVDKSIPVLMPTLSNVTSSASGGAHSVLLKTDGTVWMTGYNGVGQFGNGNTTNAVLPVQTGTLSGIIMVSAGNQHSLFLKNDGTAWGAGWNTEGELGDGSVTHRSTPVQAGTLTGLIAVSAGFNHSLFLKNDGTVWGTGLNGDGQLGNGGTVNSSSPVQVGTLTGVTAVAAGAYHSLFLKQDGTVWATGRNDQGQLGDGTTVPKSIPVQVAGLNGVIAMSGGFLHSLFLKADGTVWAVGYNTSNQLGDGTTTQRSTPVQVSGVNGVIAISAGHTHSVFLKKDGSVLAVGYNGYGGLGDGTLTTRSVAVPVLMPASGAYQGVISGSGGLVVSGAGTQIFAGQNTYTGATNLNGGVLSVNSLANGGVASGLGSSSNAASNLVFGGGALQYTGTGGSTNRAFSITGTNTAKIDVVNSVVLTQSGNIAGGVGGLMKNGAGTLLLSGTNAYSGPTTVSSGTIQAGGTQAFGTNSAVTLMNQSGVALNLNGFSNTIGSLVGGGTSGGYVVLGSGTLTTGVDNSSSVYNGVISGVGGLIKAGSGTFTLAGNNTYSGQTTVSGGILQAGGTQAFGTNSIVSLGNAGGVLLDLNGFNTSIGLLIGGGTSGGNVALGTGTLSVGALSTNSTYSGVISGSGGLTKVGTGILQLAGSNVYSGASTVSSGTLQAGGVQVFSPNSQVTLNNQSGVLLNLNGFSNTIGSLLGGGTSGGNVLIGNGTLTTGVDNSSTVFNGVISGSGSLIKAGTGTFTLSGNNVYTGMTTVSSGVLRAGGTQAFGVGGRVVLSNTAGVVLDLNGFNTTIGSLEDGGTLGGNVVLGAATLTTNGNNRSSFFNGVVSGSGGLVKMGTGTLTLQGANTYSGNTTISAGTLAVHGLIGSTGNVSNNGLFVYNGTGTQVLTGVVSGSGALQVLSGTLQLGGANTYSGVTNVNGGVLTLANPAAIGTSSVVNVAPGAVLGLGGFSHSFNTLSLAGGLIQNGTLTASTLNLDYGAVNASLSGGGAVTKNTAGTVLTLGGNNAGWTGALNVSAGTLHFTNGAAVSSANLINVSGVGAVLELGGQALVSGSLNLVDGAVVAGTMNATAYQLTNGQVGANLTGAGSLTKSGTGIVTLNGMNSLSGVTDVLGGTLNVSTPNGIGSGLLTINGASTLAIGGNNQNISGLNLVGGNIVGSGALILTAGSLNVSNGSIATGLSGTGGLIKTGAGIVTLSGANNYSGDTIISSGTLQMAGTGAILNSNTIQVSAGATWALSGGGAGVGAGRSLLVGNGSITGDLTMGSGSKLSLENSGGLASASFGGGLSLNGEVRLRLGGSLSSDNLNVSGLLSVGAGASLRLLNFGGMTGGSYTLFNYGTALNLNQFTIDSSLLGSAFHATLDISTPNQVRVTLLEDHVIASGTLESFAALSQFSGLLINGTLSFSGDEVFAGIISGSGSLMVSTGGHLILSGTNSYNGGTIVDGGTFEVISSATFAPNTALSLLNGASGFFETNNASFGLVTNAGDLTFVGSGTSTLAGLTGLGFTDVPDLAVTGTLASGTVHVTGKSFLSNVSGGDLTLDGAAMIGLLQGGSLTLGGPTVVNNLLAGSIVLNGATLSVNGGSYAQSISGSGVLTKVGTATLSITGSNTNIGGTVVQSGTLMLGNGGASGSVSGPITNNATLVVNRNDVFTLSGVNGGGVIHKMGPGTLVLTGANSASNTMILGGTLMIGDGTTDGTLAGNIFGPGPVVFNPAVNSTYAGSLSGSAGFVKQGSGTLVLSGNNGGYTGTVNVNGGTLSLVGGGALSPANVVSLNVGRLAVASGTNVSIGGLNGGGVVQLDGVLNVGAGNYNGAFAGNGALVKVGTGGLALNGNSGYAGGTTVSAGSLMISASGSLFGGSGLNIAPGGSLNVAYPNPNLGAVVNNGMLSFTGAGVTSLTSLGGSGNTSVSSNLSVGGAMSDGLVSVGGSVSFGSINGGQLSVTGPANFGFVGGGVLNLSGPSSVANLNGGAITLNGVPLTVTNGMFTGNISGNGSLVSVGNLTLLGNQGYTGGTTVSSGTLRLGDGVSSASVVGNITNNGVVEFQLPGDGIFNGVVSGPGSVVKAGAGKLSIANTQSIGGQLIVVSGTLSVAPSAIVGVSSATVRPGASLEFIGVSSDVSLPFAISGGGDVRVSNPAVTVSWVGGSTSVPVVITSHPVGGNVLFGGTYTFNVSASGTEPLTYQWRRGVTLLGGGSSSFTVSGARFTDAGTYGVTVSNVKGPVLSAPAMLTVEGINAPLQPTLFVLGGSLQLEVGVVAATSPTYRWFKDGVLIPGATSQRYEKPVATGDDNGLYKVEVTFGSGVVTTPEVPVGQSAPIVQLTPSLPVNLLGGGSVEFSTTILNGPFLQAKGLPLSYQWRRNGQLLDAVTGGSLRLNGVGFADAGLYEVTVSAGSYSAIKSNSLQVAGILVTHQPSSASRIVGGSVEFSVEAAAGGPLAYQWRKDGALVLSGGTSSVYGIPNVQQDSTGVYDVILKAGGAEVLSQGATLKVLAPVVVDTAFFAKQARALNPGQRLDLAVAASGTEPLGFQWYKNGNEILGAISPTYSVPAVSALDAGTYSVLVKNVVNVGGVTSGGVSVVVNAAPPAGVVTAVVSSGTVGAVVPGATVTLSANVPAGTDTAYLKYQWRRNRVLIDGATGNTLPLGTVNSLAQEGYYDVVLINTVDRTEWAGVQVALSQRPVYLVSDLNPITVLAGSALKWNGFVAGPSDQTLTYVWKRGATVVPGANTNTLTIPSVSLADAGTYTVTASNGFSSVISRPVTLSVIAPANITNQPVGGVFNPGTRAVFTVGATGRDLKYQWLRGGQAIPGATAPTFELPAVSAEDDVVSNPNAKLSVRVYNQDPFTNAILSSVTSDPVTVIVRKPVVLVSVTPKGRLLVDSGATVQFDVVATGTEVSYQWRRNLTPILGETKSSLSVIVGGTSTVGKYDVVVKNAVNEVQGEAGEVELKVPISITQQPVGVVSNSNKAVLLSVAATGTAPISYQWKKDGKDILAGGTASTYAIASLSGTDEGLYQVIVSNGVGTPVASNEVAVRVNDTLTITKQPRSPEPVLLDGAVKSVTLKVEATTTSTKALRYQWRKNAVPIENEISATLTIPVLSELSRGDYDVLVSTGGSAVASEVARVEVYGALSVGVLPAAGYPVATSAEAVTLKANVQGSGQALVYQWLRGTTPVGVGATLDVVPTEELTNYSVRVAIAGGTSNFGAVTSASVPVQLLKAVSIVSGPDDLVADAGTRASFAVVATGGGQIAYKWERRRGGTWEGVAGADGAQLVMSEVTPLAEGEYRVIVSNARNSVTKSAKLVVRVADVITQQPTSQIVNPGDAAVFEVKAKGVDLNYQWYRINSGRNVEAVSGGTDSTLTVNGASETALYYVQVRHAFGVSVSETVKLEVRKAVKITKSPGSVGLDSGDSVTLIVKATGSEPLTYRWLNGGTVLSGETTDRLVVKSQGNYVVEVTNPVGTAVSDAAVVTVTEPVTITVQPVKSTVVRVGDTVELAVVATGTPAEGETSLSYQWLKIIGGVETPLSDGTGVTGAKTDRLVLTNVIGVVSRTDSGTSGRYFVKVQGRKGKRSGVASAISELSVISAPVITKQPGRSVLNGVGNATFSVEAGGTGPFTYEWSEVAGSTATVLVNPQVENGGAQLVVPVPNDAVAAAKKGKSYFVKVSNAVGQVTSDAAKLIVVGKAQTAALESSAAESTAVQIVERGGSVTLLGSSVVAVEGTKLAYQWLKDGVELTGQTASSYAIGAVSKTDGGVYTRRVRVLVDAVGGDNDGAELERVTQAGTLLVINNGPVIEALQNQTVRPSQPVLFAPVVKVTDPTTGGLISAPASGVTFQWKKNNTPVTSEISASGELRIASVAPTDSGTYTVQATYLGVAGEAVSASLSVSAVAQVELRSNNGLLKSVGANEYTVELGLRSKLSLQAVATGGTGSYKYQWRFNGANIVGATRARFEVPGVGESHVGRYDVVVNTATDRVASGVVTLGLLPPLAITEQPVAKVTVNPGESMELSVGVNRSDVTYQWLKG
ncbi:MAG: autotransporter-associated beta strand repeat-containing protein, partial [Verrucomicrobiota bacterium]